MTIAVDMGRKVTKTTTTLSAMGLSAVCDCDISPWVCLQFVIVIFPNHNHLLFWGVIHANSDGFGESAHLLGLV